MKLSQLSPANWLRDKNGNQPSTAIKDATTAGHSTSDQFVMVTGGAGYIGSHFVNRYLSEKSGFYKVLIVDDLSQGDLKAVVSLEKRFPGRVRFANVQVGNTKRLVTLMKKFKVTGVVHYAGSISVADSQKKPVDYWLNNTAQTIQLLKAMDSADVRRLVFSSTAAVYGNPERVPIQEGDRKQPINTYGASKLAVEHVLDDLKNHTDEAGKSKLNYIALRYFNVAGASPDSKLGENHRNEREQPHLIPGLLQKMQDKQPLQINGQDFTTRDGTCVRDYINVNDLASAHIRALDHIDEQVNSKQSVGEAVNIGSGTGSSNMEIADAVVAEAKKHQPELLVERKFGPRRAGDPDELIASNDKAQQLLKWTPTSDLNQTVAQAWQWETGKRQYPVNRLDVWKFKLLNALGLA